MGRLTLRRRTVATVLALASVSACSSTNRPEAIGGSPSAGESASAVSLPTNSAGVPLTEQEIVEKVKKGELPKSALSAAPAAAPGAVRGGAVPASARPGSAGGAGVPSAGKSGPGFTASEIKIGISLFQPGSISETFGIDATFGDGRKQAEAVVKWVNAHGGVAGRKVVPSYYTVDFGRSGSYVDGSFEAEACEQWTNDDRVFAAVNNAMARPALLPCLAKAGVPGIHDGMPIDDKRLAPYRDYYYTGAGPKALRIDRTAKAVATVLGRGGFYRSESAARPTVVGVIHYDDEFYAHVVNTKMVPIIKGFGVAKVVVQAAPYGATTPDATYVARFQQEGVTHVHFLGEANAYPMTFMPAAESQGYRPRYGISTEQYPNLLETTAPIPREQLANARGVGWSQLLDVNNPADPGPTGPNDALCLEIQKAAGQDMSARGARFTATTYCHALFFLQKSFGNVASLTPAGLAKGVAALGTAYSSPGVFNPTRYTPTQHDGGGTYREFVWREGAFIYTTGNTRLPV